MRDRDATPLRTRAEQIIDELAAGAGCDCAGWELCRTCAPVTQSEKQAALTDQERSDIARDLAAKQAARDKPREKGMRLGH